MIRQNPLVMIPGPTPVAESIRQALAGPTYGHTYGPFVTIYKECLAGLKTIFQADHVVAIGGEAVDTNTPSLVPKDDAVVTTPIGQEREGQIMTAISLLVEKNDASDFTATGCPSVKALENVLGFDVDRSEVVDAWKKFNAEKA